MINYRTIILGVIIVLAVTYMQGPCAHLSPDELSELNKGPINIFTANLITIGFIVGTFLIIAFFYYLFDPRGRSFKQILRIERDNDMGKGLSDSPMRMPLNWKLLSRFIAAQLIIIIVSCPLFIAFQSSKYSHLNYKKYSSVNYQSLAREAPRNYSFVMVRKDPDGKTISEIYFTPSGLMKTVEYQDGKWTSSSESEFSNIFPIIAGVISMALLIFLNMVNYFGKTEWQDKMFSYGMHLFLSVFPVILIKGVLGILVDSLLH